MNGCYFDTAYIAKCYLNEPDSEAVRAVTRLHAPLYSSVLSRAEFACVLHRHVRERSITRKMAAGVGDRFRADVQSGVWILLPVTERIVHDVEEAIRTIPSGTFLRAVDAVHLVSASDAGHREIWTNDRHLLAAAPHFGLKGRSVS